MDAKLTAAAGSAIRPAIVGPLLMAVAVTGAQMFIVSPLMADIGATYQVSPSRVGLVVSGGSLATAVMAALVVPIMDRFPRRNVLVAALLLMTAALALAALAPSLEAFAVAFAIAGAATGIVLPTTYALAGDVSAEHERGRLLGLILMGWSVSFFLQPFASKFGDLIGWRGAYGLIAALGLVSAGLNLTLPRGSAGRPGAGIGAYGQAFAVPGFIALLLATLCFMYAFYGVYPYWGTAYRAVHGGDASAASLLAVGYGMGYVVMAMLSRFVGRLTSWRMVFIAYCGLVVAYLALGPALADRYAIIGWCTVLGILNNAGLGALVATFVSLSSERRGSIMAIYSATSYVGFTIGASTMGPVFERYGLGTNGLCSAAAMVLGAGLAVIARRQWEKSREQAA